MRGTTYAIVEILVFLIGAILIGYALGRLGWLTDRRRTTSQLEAKVNTVEARAEKLESRLAARAGSQPPTPAKPAPAAVSAPEAPAAKPAEPAPVTVSGSPEPEPAKDPKKEADQPAEEATPAELDDLMQKLNARLDALADQLSEMEKG